MVKLPWLQREANMMRSGDTTFGHYHSTLRVVPLFETLSDLAGCQASMRRLFECEWYVLTHGTRADP